MYTVVIQTHRGADTTISVSSVPGFSNERLANQAGRRLVAFLEEEGAYASFTVVQVS